MASNKNFLLSRMVVLASVLVTTLVVFFIGFQLETVPSEDSQMDRWVGIATVCTAIASIVVGLITIWVMFDQQKMQDRFLEYQKMEHQPNFIVRNLEFLGYDEEGKDSSYEELEIYNYGIRSFLIKDIQVNTFLVWGYNHQDRHLVDNVHLYDYWGNMQLMSDNDLIFKTKNSNVRRNLAKYNCLSAYSRSLYGFHDAPNIRFGKNTMVMIEYIDLYNESRVKYFQNGCPVDKKTYEKYTAFQPGHYASIDDFDLKEYMSRHYPSESQKVPGKCRSDIS